jgi:GGDEF domain-containing protein
MLTGRTDVADRLAAFECGVDDYLEKPIKISELVERVRLLQQADPTRNSARLLGSVDIYDDLRRRLEAGQPVAVVITEIQGLRPFTRHYGFARGESLVGALAELLRELARQEPEGLAGRLGAQDFIALVDPAQAAGFAAALHSSFDARRPSFYDPVDALRGWIDVPDRMGRTRRHRPMRLAVGVATSPGGQEGSPEGGVPQVLHHLDLLERAAELARYARTAAGGPVAFDRRS